MKHNQSTPKHGVQNRILVLEQTQLFKPQRIFVSQQPV
ncbi:MAG: hypothetical protein ACI9FD_001409, partial [Gammaproteobacteria bacterium]